MSQESTLDKLNRIYDKYKKYFPNTSFHSVLWLIMINDRFKNEKAAFTAQYKTFTNGSFLNLGIACGCDGWIPSMAYFADGTKWDDAEDICDELNREIFGLEPNEAFEQVIVKSMWITKERKN